MYKKYVPAAYAKKLNIPKTPAVILRATPKPEYEPHVANCTMNAMKYKIVAIPVFKSS